MESFVQQRKTTSRDARVEGLRLLACFFVICLHAKPSSVVEGTPVFARYLFSNLIADAITIFFLMTGFYFARKEPYLKRLIKCLRQIVLPAFVYTLFFLAYESNWFRNTTISNVFHSLLECVRTWTPVIHNTGHLWYLYIHVLLVVLSPVLVWFMDHCLSARWQQVLCLLIVGGSFFLNDTLSNGLFHCTQIPLTSLIPAILLVFAGHSLFHLLEQIGLTVYLPIVSFLLYLSINIQRANSLTRGTIQMSDAMFSFSGVACGALLCTVFLSLPKRARAFDNIINTLASTTFVVYIWHVLMMEFTITFGIKVPFVQLVTDGTESLFSYLSYTLSFSLLIFAACALLAFLYRGLRNGLYRLLSPKTSASET